MKRFALILTAVFFIAGNFQADTAQAETTGDQPLNINKTVTTDDQVIEAGATVVKRDEGEVEDETSFGLTASYGQLFGATSAGHQGFGYVTGMLNTDSRYRLNASLGYFLPGFGGELLTTYRLLSAEVRDQLAMYGEFEEQANEHSIALSYTRYMASCPKEISLNYSYSVLSGEESDKVNAVIDTASTWRRAELYGGFGDVETHDVGVNFAFGKDGIEGFLTGYRLELGGGFESVTYEAFGGFAEESDDGFAGLASLQVNTNAGSVTGSYRTGQSGDIFHAGYRIGGLEVFYRDIDYERGVDDEVYGLSFSVDLANIGNALHFNTSPLFAEQVEGYGSVNRIRHIARISSDDFISKPVVRDASKDIYVVDKTQLGGRTTIDTATNTLIIRVSSTLTGLKSVSPSSAKGAVSVGSSSIKVSLAALPVANQTVVIKANETSGGYTRVSIKTSVGSLRVDQVQVKEGIDIPVAKTEAPVPAVPKTVTIDSFTVVPNPLNPLLDLFTVNTTDTDTTVGAPNKWYRVNLACGAVSTSFAHTTKNGTYTDTVSANIPTGTICTVTLDLNPVAGVPVGDTTAGAAGFTAVNSPATVTAP